MSRAPAKPKQVYKSKEEKTFKKGNLKKLNRSEYEFRGLGVKPIGGKKI